MPKNFNYRHYFRDSLIKTLTNADGNGDCALADRLATELENCIYSEFNNTSVRYQNKVRSTLFNLKDTKNQQLRSNFISGAITPAQLAKISVEEMASDEMKTLRKYLNDISLRQLIGP